MTPASFFTGAPAGQRWAEKEDRKAPSVAGGAQNILVREIQRTRNLLGSPAQGGLKNKGGPHHGRAMETAHDKTPQMPDALCNAGYESTISRLDGCCLCAISQLTPVGILESNRPPPG